MYRCKGTTYKNKPCLKEELYIKRKKLLIKRINSEKNLCIDKKDNKT